MHQDPIADMLTRIRNAILLSEGFITSYKEVKTKEGHKNIEVTLKYGPNGEKVISGLKRISKPGLRVTADSKHIPFVLKGLGIAIISTSKGLLTDKGCRQNNVGGEVICYVW